MPLAHSGCWWWHCCCSRNLPQLPAACCVWPLVLFGCCNTDTTYHIKLAIADGDDDKIDAVVWIRAGSVRFKIKDCVGAWVPHTWGPFDGTCTGVCEGGIGLLPEVFFISVAAANGGCKCVRLQRRVCLLPAINPMYT